MAKRNSKGPKNHSFRNKLLLNQWVISLFGINTFSGITGPPIRPFHLLADLIRDPRLEGFHQDNLHHFFHALTESELFRNERCILGKEQILRYEENIVRHTQHINEKRHRPVVWKYFQWLSLLFTEIYLDRFFSNRDSLLSDLNAYRDRFNRFWQEYADVPAYHEDDLNKVCLQNATGSGKTLLMHINILQYRHYAKEHGRENELSRMILLTPNERLSEQHIAEFRENGIYSLNFAQEGHNLFTQTSGLARVDVLEITKLAEQEGPNTIATRSLGDQNLLLVDEGHRGMSGKEEGVWFTRRSELCARGFTFEYSATFEQAVQASGNAEFGNSYARTVLFDYSYRWFYEDGFGKDYRILNLPDAFEETQAVYLTACLLRFYQQLRIYEENRNGFRPFHLEKPLWVFVGSTVSSGKLNREDKIVATDVALIIRFIADFLNNRLTALRRIYEILTGKGRDTGLLDKEGKDIFDGAFTCLAHALNAGESPEDLCRDILERLFHNAAGGNLSLERIRGESGEVALRVGTSEIPFGLINVGDAKGLCDHVLEVAKQNAIPLTVKDSDFSESMFASVRDSASPIHLLIGSKKFVEGWDCWRVSTMGLMHVGRSEGSQIIQLFGRGVRLKGYEYGLKRSAHCHAADCPPFIEELETLNVFGIEADFMQKFRDFLKEEGLPGNERRKVIRIPLNVTCDFGKKLKILRPKRKTSDSREYDFKKDAPVPAVGHVPDYLRHNTVVADRYPRIQALQSRSTALAGQKDRVSLGEEHLAFLDYDALCFELEQFKRERSWHNLNISKQGIRSLLSRNDWYSLYLPENRLHPADFSGVLLLQQVAAELLKRYCAHYYHYCKREYMEPRLELRELTQDDDNIPQEEFYQIIVDGDEKQVFNSIEEIKKELEKNRGDLLKIGDLSACRFGKHLFQPLFHVRKGARITVLPVALNESEYRFVCDLKTWCKHQQEKPEADETEIYLFRNQSRGKGVGFFEAGNFHPDFILWMLSGDRQYVTFIEPHGLLTEGPGSEKILFYKRIRDIEKRLDDPGVILNSFVLSWTKFSQLKWGKTQEELEDMHILFMESDRPRYMEKLFRRLKKIPEKTLSE